MYVRWLDAIGAKKSLRNGGIRAMLADKAARQGVTSTLPSLNRLRGISATGDLPALSANPA